MRDVLKVIRSWPWALILLALPATVAVWSGWVGLGSMTGFGKVHPLPGIADEFTLDSAITLPVGVEVYGAYALGVWLSHRRYSNGTRRFACVSSIGGLVLGGAGQVAYHLLEVAYSAKVAHVAKESHRTVEQVAKDMPPSAPWWITTIVACFPVMVLGAGATLAHLTRRDLREVSGHVTPNITGQAAEFKPETIEEPEGVSEDSVPWVDEPTSGPLETWYEHAEPEPARNVPENARNVSGNVLEDARNASPWGAVSLTKPWPLPDLDARTERLVSAAAGLTSNGSNGVPGAFPKQVNGSAPPPDEDEEEPAGDDPDPAEDLDAETVKNARETFATELSNGETISVRQIMNRCNVGYPKAKKIKAVLDPE